MRLKYFMFFFIFICMVGGNTLVAQQKWSLNQCVSFAIENNIDLSQYNIQEKMSGEAFNQSKRDLLPGVSLSSNAGLSFGRSVDPNTNDIINTEFFNNTYNLSSSVVLFDGFRLQNQIQYEKFRKKVSEYNRLNAVDDLAFGVMNAFFDIIYYRGMLEIAKEQVETSKLNMKATEKQAEVGIKSKSDLLEVRANLEAEQLRRIQIENSLVSAHLKLSQLMNMTNAVEVEPSYEEYSVLNETIPLRDQLFESYTSWSPYFQSFMSQLKASEKSLAISRSALYPSLIAGGSINTGYSETYKDNSGNVIGFGEQFKNNKSQSLGASLSLPIFSRWDNRSNIKQAKLEVELAKARLSSEKQKLYFEMTSTLNELEALGKEFLQYEKQKEVDQLAYQTAEKKFDQGLISVIDFYVVKNRYANSNSQVLRAKLQLEMKKKTIEFYSGKRFWE